MFTKPLRQCCSTGPVIPGRVCFVANIDAEKATKMPSLYGRFSLVPREKVQGTIPSPLITVTAGIVAGVWVEGTAGVALFERKLAAMN